MPAMPLDEIRVSFLKLHDDVGALMNAASHLHPSIWLSVHRKPLKDLEALADQYSHRFVELDGHFLQHTMVPAGATINSAMKQDARLSIHVAARDGVQGLLVAANGILAGIRGRLDVTLSVVLALVALVVAIVSFLRDALKQ